MDHRISIISISLHEAGKPRRHRRDRARHRHQPASKPSRRDCQRTIGWQRASTSQLQSLVRFVPKFSASIFSGLRRARQYLHRQTAEDVAVHTQGHRRHASDDSDMNPWLKANISRSGRSMQRGSRPVHARRGTAFSDTIPPRPRGPHLPPGAGEPRDWVMMTGAG